jgi:transposase
MRQKSGTGKAPAEQVIKDIRRATRKQDSAEEKIRIVLEGLRGENRSRRFAGARGSSRACITTGRRSSLKPARSGLCQRRSNIRPLGGAKVGHFGDVSSS